MFKMLSRNLKPFSSVAPHRVSSSAPGPASNKFTLGICQLLVSDDKAANLRNAAEQIALAVKKGASLVVLPECFNCPYTNSAFPEFAEPVSANFDPKASPSLAMLSQAAKDGKITLVGGSIPERDSSGHLYNTCTVWDRNGKLVTKFRKAHLFDIDIPGKIRFKESDTLTPGNELVRFTNELTTFGLGICYDIRFPSMSRSLTADGKTKVLIFPGAFNTTTGPLHWELLQRARAVDYQVYVITASPARGVKESKWKGAPVIWGHSSVINPWGKVIATTEHDQDLIIAEIDLDEVESMRNSIPTRKQQRPELYAKL